MPTISIIIPTYNEENYLGLLLTDLVNQTQQPDKIIVADCTSKDKTIPVAQSFIYKLPLQVVTSKVRSAAAARNAGTKIASTDYIIFIDADMRLPIHLIEEIQQSLTASEVDYLTPRYSVDDLATFVDKFQVWSVNWWMNIQAKYLHKAPGIGGIMCVKKSLHDKIGGFIDSEQTFDDIHYLQKINQLNATYLYSRDLIVIVSSRRTIKDGKIISLLRFISEDSLISKLLIQPILKKLGKTKQYGHYDE